MRYSLKTILKHLYMFDNYIDVLDMYSQYIHTDIFIKKTKGTDKYSWSTLSSFHFCFVASIVPYLHHNYNWLDIGPEQFVNTWNVVILYY